MDIKNRILKITLSILVASILFVSNSCFAAESKIIAYYFHGSFRCPTCRKLERYSKEAIEGNFKDEIAKGILEFKAVNVEEKGNKHFVDDYRLYTKQLVISEVEDGKETRYKNLEKIWEYVRNKEKFFDYVINEIQAYLKE